MADTTFVNGVTLTDADWFNDVNRLHYTILGDPASATAVRGAVLPHATVAAHATTMDPWAYGIATLSGGAVTFTDIADADYIGQTVLLIMNAAHVFTDGAVFDVQGGANYTAEAGDLVLLTATAVDAFDMTIFRASGTPVTMLQQQTFLGANVNLNNTSNYFNIVNTGSIGAAGQVWLIVGQMAVADTSTAAQILFRIWDGSTVIVESEVTAPAATYVTNVSIFAVVTLSGAATLYLSAKDGSSTNGVVYTTGNSGTANKATSIIAMRLK